MSTEQLEQARGADASPFHEGEQAVQSRMGVKEGIEPWARQVIRPFMPDQHRDFFEQLPFLVVSGRDADGRPWVTLLAGEPGFVNSPDPKTLGVAAHPMPGDALEGSLGCGQPVGMLGAEGTAEELHRLLVEGGEDAVTVDALSLVPRGGIRWRETFYPASTLRGRMRVVWPFPRT